MLLDKDAQSRMVAHRERFTAPFSMFDKMGRVFRGRAVNCTNLVE
jgi:hypothetical protein